MASTLVEELRSSADQRGIVFEPLEAEALSAQKNAHVVMTEPGAIRGNHYHERTLEIAVLVGPALVRFREHGLMQEVVVPAGRTYRFTFPPRVSHAFQNTGTSAMVLVAFANAPFDRTHPDTIADVLIPPPGTPV